MLVVSIADPERSANGAGTVTRGLIGLLRLPPSCAAIECLALPVDAPAVMVLETADAWVNMLGSRTADALGGARLSAATSGLFAPEGHARAFQAFVAASLSGTDN